MYSRTLAGTWLCCVTVQNAYGARVLGGTQVQAKELIGQVHVQCDPMHLHPKRILRTRGVMGLQLKPGVARVDSATASTGVSLFTQES